MFSFFYSPSREIVLKGETGPFGEPLPYSTAQWGTEWAKKEASVAVAVPSAVIPKERNVILNPDSMPGFNLIDGQQACNTATVPDIAARWTSVLKR